MSSCCDKPDVESLGLKEDPTVKLEAVSHEADKAASQTSSQ